MKVGSLVVWNGKSYGGPKVNTINREATYTVREIIKSNDASIGNILRFEEIINIKCMDGVDKGREMGYIISAFDEIQPPMDLTELLEETKVLELVNQ